MKTIIFFAFIIIIIIIWLLYISIYENFQSKDAIILYENPSNSFIETRYISNQELHRYIDQLKANNHISYPNNNIQILSLVIDPLIEYNHLNNINLSIRDFSQGYFLSLSRLRPYTCTFDLQQKTIGYITETDLNFIKAIIHGHRIDPSTVNLKRMNPNAIDFNAVNSIITFISINSRFYKNILDEDLYIYGFKDIDINRIRLFYPFVDDFFIEIKDMFKTNNLLKLEEGKTNIPKITLRIINNINNHYQQENFISRLEVSPEIFDKDYTCYGMPDIDNRALCNSKYDAVGNAKDFTSIWDKQCKSNDDCPFYKANKNYPNSRGGCLSGYCEFPVGIKRLGYRKYDSTYPNTPFCYGVSDCKKQKNPDYAFPFDQKDRILNNKEIIIHKM